METRAESLRDQIEESGAHGALAGAVYLESELAGGLPGRSELVRNVIARPEVHLVQRLATEGRVR